MLNEGNNFLTDLLENLNMMLKIFNNYLVLKCNLQLNRLI